MDVCRGCNKSYASNSLLRHVARNETCKESYPDFQSLKAQKTADCKRRYSQVHKEELVEKQAKYNAINRTSINEKQAKYNTANKETINEKQAKYNAANKEAINEKRAKYNSANKETINVGLSNELTAVASVR